MTISELKMYRKKHAITQLALSKLIKKDPTFICKLEGGNRRFTEEIQKKIKKAIMKRVFN